MHPVWHRRSIRIFFALGFGLPWLGWTSILLFETPGALRTALFYTGDFMSIGGIVATWAAGGAAAVRALFQRCFARAGLGWWAAALLLPLAWPLVARLGYGVSHGGLGAPDLGALSLYVSIPAWRAWTTGPLGEEFGWRGYFLPRLLAGHAPLTASLILGVLWGIWHYPLYAESVFSTLPRASSFVISTVCFSILMTVFWFRTRGSILIAILFHWSVNVSPRVVEALLPLEAPHRATLDFWNLAILIIVTLGFGIGFGWRTLGGQGDFQVQRDLPREKVTD